LRAKLERVRAQKLRLQEIHELEKKKKALMKAINEPKGGD
jgi:hypothetical protein